MQPPRLQRRRVFYLETSPPLAVNEILDSTGLEGTARLEPETVSMWLWDSNSSSDKVLPTILDKAQPCRLIAHCGEATTGKASSAVGGPAWSLLRRLKAVERANASVVTGAYVEFVRDVPDARDCSDFRRIGVRSFRGHGSVEVYTARDDSSGEIVPEMSITCLDPPPDLFVGREQRIERLLGAIDENRWVTIQGSAGIGKTRLAKEAGLRWRASRPRGSVVFVEFPGRNLDESDVFAQIATTVDVSGRGESLEQLVGSLSSVLEAYGPFLLILDNVEHNLDAIQAAVGRLFQSTDRDVRFLFTTRQAFENDSEKVVTLGPLGRDEALLLLEKRIQHFRKYFSPTSAVYEDMKAIVAQTDGLPLAIELLAARARGETLSKLAESLGASTGIGGYDDSLDRAIHWSWSKLDARQQNVLTLCGVFVAGFSARMVRQIVRGDVDVQTESATEDGGPTIRRVLESLSRHSLVEREQSPTGDEVMYRMYHPVARFCRNQLTSDNLNSLRENYLSYFLKETAKWHKQLLCGNELAPLNWFQEHAKHLFFCIEWAFDRDDIRGAELMGNMSLFLEHRRPVEQFRPLLASGIELAASVGRNELRIRLQYYQMRTALIVGDFERGERLFEELLEQLDSADVAPHLEARIYMIGGNLYRLIGDFERAKKLLDRALDIASAHEFLAVCSGIRIELGFLERDSTHLDAGKRHFSRALQLADEIDRLGTKRAALSGFRGIALRQGHVDQSLEYAHRALETARQSQNRRQIAEELMCLGSMYPARGEYERAIQTFRRALEKAYSMGAKPLFAVGCLNLGGLYLTQTQLKKAKRYIKQGANVLRDYGSAWLRAQSLPLLALIDCLDSSPAAAGQRLNEAGKLGRGNDFAPEWFGDVLAMLEKLIQFTRDLEDDRPVDVESVRSDLESFEETRSSNERFQMYYRPIRTAFELLADRSSTPQNFEQCLILDPNGLRVSVPGQIEWTDLSERGPLRQMLIRLVEQRQKNPGRVVPYEELIEVGWPNLDPEAIDLRNRLWMAISQLRSLGLEDAIETVRGEGYVIPANFEVERLETLQPS